MGEVHQELDFDADGIGGTRSNARRGGQRQPDCIETSDLTYDLRITITNPRHIVTDDAIDVGHEAREIGREGEVRQIVRACRELERPIVDPITCRLRVTVGASRQIVLVYSEDRKSTRLNSSH